MKARIGFNFLVCALALTCIVSTGCRKKPVGVTPLPGSRTVDIGGPGGSGIMNGGAQAGDVNGVGSSTPSGIAQGSGHPGWSEDRDALKTETVYFDYDSSTIKSSEKSKIDSVTSYLKSNTSVAVKVEGNCDERGTEEYNRALGERRALAVREYLVNSGIAAERVDTTSYGEDKPAVQGHDEAAWKLNRRDEFVVLTAPK
jgi:peptidoglycan-associated lipoprotein